MQYGLWIKYGKINNSNVLSGQRKACGATEACSTHSSSNSSKISTEQVTKILERIQSRQTRESTKNNYLCIWRQLNKFVIKLDTRESLSWEEKTALFGACLVDRGVQSSTLRSYFSAIKFILKQDGYPWDDQKALLSALIRGCRLENDSVKVRLPIKKGLLEVLLFELERKFGKSNNPQPYLECMYKAMISLTYYGMLRVGEIALGPHTIKAKDMHFAHSKDKILIVLYSSKTHGKESRPQRVKISATDEKLLNKSVQHSKFFCPFKLTRHYMAQRGNYIDDTELLFIFSDGSPLQPHHIRGVLRDLLNQVGLDSSLYDVHSFRIGRTCDLYKYGYSLDQIKSLGRWRSNAVYKYLKD